MSKLNRRRVLRGILHGGVVTVALPLLDCFLDPNGEALASGEPMPVRFGTWFWSLGMDKTLFIPEKVGAGYEITPQLEGIRAVRDHINVFTNFNIFKDGHSNICHHTGWIGLRTGMAPVSSTDFPGETIDVTIARKIGGVTRFRSLTATATGDARDSVSYQGQNATVPPETSPVAFYQRLFGSDFQDPNGSTFTPSPRIMAQKSVLSGVLDEAKTLDKTLGAADRARLDQYFTGLRELERQFDQQLRKPRPIATCVRPIAPEGDPPQGVDTETLRIRHRMMSDLLVMAIACDQTRVFNMVHSAPFAATTRVGYDKTHHGASHEEVVNSKLGYQPPVAWFVCRALENWGDFVQAFAQVKEGDGTLLDNVVIYGHSDVQFAKTHSTDGIPMFTAGRAGGRLKTGLHINGKEADSGARLGYTLQRVMGLDVNSWGTESNTTSKVVDEILI
ncbi:MAG TPA: DUF1552 domain-containing protein [Steroidobacteraceae bacterium]